MQNDRQMAAAAKQPSAVNPRRFSATESVSATNSIFRLPSYEQVIGSRATSSSRLVKSDSGANEVFVPSPQSGSSSFAGNAVPSLLADRGSSAAGAASLLLSQSAADSAAIAGHMQLDSNELLRQLEQILSEPGLCAADVDNAVGGCHAVATSLPQSLSALDQRAISLIQSQLMSVETSPSSPAVASGPQYRNGTLCQLLGGNPPPTSNALLSTDKSEIRLRGSLPPTESQPLLSADTSAVKSSHIAAGQYEFVLGWLKSSPARIDTT